MSKFFSLKRLFVSGAGWDFARHDSILDNVNTLAEAVPTLESVTVVTGKPCKRKQYRCVYIGRNLAGTISLKKTRGGGRMIGLACNDEEISVDLALH
jgi:hypothetical protein